MELVWNDFIENWSLEQYFEGKRRHGFVTGASGVFARWGKDSVSGDSQPEENENRSEAIKPSSARYPWAGLSCTLLEIF